MGVADRILLDVANRRRLGADLTRAVVSVERTGSMEAKPGLVVTVDDPRDRLMESRVLTRPAIRAVGTPAAATLRPIDLLLDGVWYRLQQARRDSDTVQLTFDHRGAVYMEQHTAPLSSSRNDVTRAQFIRRQVEEVGRRRGAGHKLAFWTWEARRRMPIARGEQVSSRSESDRDPAQTVTRAKDGKGLTVKGVTANAEQRRNMAIAAETAEELKASPKATLALFCAGIGESDFEHKPNMEGSRYTGVWQSDRKYGHTVREQARLFLKGGQGFQAGGAMELARRSPGLTPGDIATRVEASGKPGEFYNRHRGEAAQAIDALGGVSTGASFEGGSYVKPYRFRRPRGEGGWVNTGKLAEEVGRRRFITVPVRGVDLFVYAADADLLRLRSQAVLSLDGRYIVGVPQYDLDYGKTARAMTLSVMGDLFDADFAWGLPVTVEDAGPASGKWLVWDVHERDGSPVVDLELRMPQTAKAEPAAEVVQRSDGSTADPLASLDGDVSGRPKEIIDKFVIPLARKHHMVTGNTAAAVAAANARHSMNTTSGKRSDHKGPPNHAWAADMSNGGSPTPQMDRLARDLADAFGIPWSGAGLVSHTRGSYRFQLIYRAEDHYDHVHFGVKKV